MSAANVSGIPHSFVLDSAGVVKFQGHPADPSFEKAVAQVCRGSSQTLCDYLVTPRYSDPAHRHHTRQNTSPALLKRAMPERK